MEEYKSNSHKSKEGRTELAETGKKKVEPIAGIKARTQKRTKADSVREDLANVRSYIIRDVLIPSAKKTFLDIITNGANMLVYPDGKRPKKRNYGPEYVSYNRYYDDNDRNNSSRDRLATILVYDDIVVDTRGDADAILEQMDALIDRYGIVSIADMCELAGVSCDYTYNKYGWTSLRTANVVPARGGGWRLSLPAAKPIG